VGEKSTSEVLNAYAGAYGKRRRLDDLTCSMCNRLNTKQAARFDTPAA
jgi:hypothetical protein